MSSTGQAGYRPEVDGLRAVAVLSVIFFHAGFAWCSGGFVGVDVFFVISGFLITGIIVDDQRQGLFTLARFYARRARRILPALAFVLLACAVPAYVLMTPAQLADYFRMLTAVALFHSNFLLGETTGYFDGPAEERPLLHTWSLAVEEQYYFVFPLVVAVCWKLGPRRLLAVLAVAAVASLAASEYGWRHYRGQNFFFTPSRVWELLLGSMAALLASGPNAALNRFSVTARQLLAALGLAAVLASIVLFDRLTPTPSAWVLIPTLGTALVLLFGATDTWTARILSMPLLVWAGLISYSAYLWHQPLMAFARIHSLEPVPTTVKLGLIALTLLLAFVTWKFIEQPVRKMKNISNTRTLTLAAICTVLLALLGVAGNLAAQSARSAVPASVLKAFEQPPRSKTCFDIPYAHNKSDGWLCDLNAKSQAAPSFVLFGDSHALQLLETFEAAAQQTGRRGVFTGFSGCAPLLGVYPLTRPDQATQNCPALNDRMLAYVKERQIKDVFLVAKWSYYTDFWNNTAYLNAIGLVPGEAVSIENSRRAFDQGFARTVKAYADAGVRLYVIEQAPQQPYPPAAIYNRAWTEPARVSEMLRAMSVPVPQHKQLQAFANSVFTKAKGRSGVQILNFDNLFCDPQICLVGTPTTSYYNDPSHLSEDGARRLKPAITRLLSGQQ